MSSDLIEEIPTDERDYPEAHDSDGYAIAVNGGLCSVDRKAVRE